MARITVVVATYRRPSLLTQTLRSVEAQTWEDYEVLVCDNGADEETEQVVASFDNDRFVYVRREHNLGMLGNVISGMGAADSELVMKVDDDDLLLPHSLESLVEPFSRHTELALCFGQMQFIDHNSDLLENHTATLRRKMGWDRMNVGLIPDGTHLVVRGAVPLTASVVRKDAVDWGAVPEDVATAYDLHVALAAVAGGRPIFYTGTTAISYRVHPGSDSTQQLVRQAEGACCALERALATREHADRRALKRRLAEVDLDAARGLLRERDPARSRLHLRRSVRLRPTLTAVRLFAMSLMPPTWASRISLTRAKRYRDRAWRPGSR